MEQGEIILYQPDEAVKLEVRLEEAISDYLDKNSSLL
jgi:hypothetical protein